MTRPETTFGELFQNVNGAIVPNQKEGDSVCRSAPVMECSGEQPARDIHTSRYSTGSEAAPKFNPLVAAVDGRSVGRGNERQIAALDKPKAFDGNTYDPNQDGTRLKAQLVRVRELMRDGKWRSLSEISEVTGDPEASTSARLRDLRKPRFGMWTVDRRRVAGGLYQYKLGGKGL